MGESEGDGRKRYRCEACDVERLEHPQHLWCMRCPKCGSTRYWVVVKEGK